ncbi:uncharacterized protein DS421_11g342850 [Arachis hypogaea]|nr:uncharacterized protein DS421_11g342850 [Arachis hypogaea]
MGRSPSRRRGTNQSLARVRQAAVAAIESGDRKMDNPAMEEGKWSSSANNESLEGDGEGVGGRGQGGKKMKRYRGRGR